MYVIELTTEEYLMAKRALEMLVEEKGYPLDENYPDPRLPAFEKRRPAAESALEKIQTAKA
jgi:hypothetical protein